MREGNEGGSRGQRPLDPPADASHRGTAFIQLVSLAHPCGACSIINSLALNVCERLAREYDQVTFERVILAAPGEARFVDGLEVEALPALIFNGEQITAGTIPDRRAIEARLRE